MRPLVCAALLVSAAFAQEKKEYDLAGKDGPFPGVDKARLEQLAEVKTARLEEEKGLKIQLQRLESEFKGMLLEGAELPELWENCRERGELWAKIQYAQLKADTKRREILNEKEWKSYLMWKLKLEEKWKNKKGRK